jgi:hypothetical protein
LTQIFKAAQTLTGARQAFLVLEVTDETARLEGEEVPDDHAWLQEAGRLMILAAENGWRVTLLSEQIEPRSAERCLLAVTAQPGIAAPGLLLQNKRRLHALDGTVFSEFDGELAQKLARLLPLTLQAIDRKKTTSPRLPDRAEAGPLPGEEAVASAKAEPLPLESPRAGQPGQVGEEPPAWEPAKAEVRRTQREVLLAALRREMDRCDRYHATFALAAFRPRSSSWDYQRFQDIAANLAERVRSSDFLVCLEDGTLLVILPEEVQAVARQQRRLTSLLQDLTGQSDLEVATSGQVYPGRHQDPAHLLDDTLSALA